MTARPLLLAACLLAALPAHAQDLRIGFKAAVDSADPHQLYTPNRNVHLQVYEPLVVQDAQQRLKPGLAKSWKPLDPLTWEITLEERANFQDGTPFTADDVIFSVNRARAAEGVRTYRIYVRDIAAMEAKGPKTLIVRTLAPAPMLPTNLSAFGMVSAKAAATASSADFNAGPAAIGTGPYRWAKFIPGQEVVLERNPGWWGGAVPWAKVSYRFVPNDSARVAGLLAGDLDVIDTVPPNLFERIETSDRTQLVTTTSSFTLYFQLDQKRDESPFVTAADGSKLGRNPLKDQRVRQAMSLALNRAAIAERAMENGAEPAFQFMPPGFDGHSPNLPPPAADLPRARRLLAEAGYPQGFGLTIHCTNDRYAGDAKVCQTVAQMLTSVGLKVQVDTLPAAVFFRRAGSNTAEPEFSAQMSIFSNPAGVGLENMNALVRTASAERGYGTANRGRYSTPAMDAALAAAEAEFDVAKREEMVRKATEAAMADYAVVPIFFMKASWGLKKGLKMLPRGDQYTFANDITP
jgi:peptide/nickel transport system substrate-binding protein